MTKRENLIKQLELMDVDFTCEHLVSKVYLFTVTGVGLFNMPTGYKILSFTTSAINNNNSLVIGFRVDFE